MTMLIEMFFEKLSYRLYKENHLSDITWAMIESCLDFRRLFIQFFFGEQVDVTSPISIKREHSSGNCRADFYLKAGSVEYIIECKVNDGNHHFEDYRLEWPAAKLGYIANYDIKDVLGYEIRTWKGFYTYILSFLETGEMDVTSRELICGYLQYLKGICGIFKIEKMKLDGLIANRFARG